MHEMSLMSSILQRAEAALMPYIVKSVNSITVDIGILANIMSDAFSFAFEALSTNTIFAGAQLIINKKPIIAHCQYCDKEFLSNQIPPLCPICQQSMVQIKSGDEVNLVNIDFEEEG